VNRSGEFRNPRKLGTWKGLDVLQLLSGGRPEIPGAVGEATCERCLLLRKVGEVNQET